MKSSAWRSFSRRAPANPDSSLIRALLPTPICSISEAIGNACQLTVAVASVVVCALTEQVAEARLLP